VPEELLTTQEIARVLRVHPKHVYRLLKKGLPARRVGSEWRFSLDDVTVWSGGNRDDARHGSPTPTAPTARHHKDVVPEAAPALVAANGDLAVLTLLRLAAARGAPFIGLVQADCGSATDQLLRGQVLAAGAHGHSFPGHVGEERVARLHLADREVGLAFRRNEPFSIDDIAWRRLASRPPSAGVRRYLEELLREQGHDPKRVHRRALILDSHLDVVLAVASGKAEAGICSRAWSERVGLGFHALTTEAYGLILKARDLGDARVVRLCEVAQSEQFRTELGTIAGYDPSGSGEIRYE
jgi:putative molybdopterin biosynthesis protein